MNTAAFNTLVKLLHEEYNVEESEIVRLCTVLVTNRGRLILPENDDTPWIPRPKHEVIEDLLFNNS